MKSDLPRVHLFLLACLVFAMTCVGAVPVVVAGEGSYSREFPDGAKRPPATIYATTAASGPMPTNDWWSSLAWMPFSERQYPHPLAMQAESGGLRIYYPGQNITANVHAIFGFMPAGTHNDLLLGHSEQEEFVDARVDGFSDWFVQAKFAVDDRCMTVSYGHGSPFVFARFRGGNPQVTLPKSPEVWFGDRQSAVLGITVNGKHYGLFGPGGASWRGLGGPQLTCETTKDYFSIAILPDGREDTLKLFQKYAHSHITDSQIAFAYDPNTSTVTTTYSVEAEVHEGNAAGTLLALYPHQWRYTDAQLLGSGYKSVRGDMKLWAGTSFQTKVAFPGVLPSLPNAGGCDASTMKALLALEIDAKLDPTKDTYWEGKTLGKMATLIPIAQQYDQQAIADELQTRLQTRLEQWFTPNNASGQPKQASLFCYDDHWGTLIGYPASYGSDADLNDHHFHYGYFIRAAGEIARTNPAWADDWGGMIELLIRDIASFDRNDPLFPFLRNFDPYAGHSWASGHAKFGDGNNNESSSEAMNAWYGMILWGEFTGNTKIRDLGIALYTTEMTAIHEYWFDVHDSNHPETYSPSVVTMIWGGKGANGTWFSGDPEMVHGINWLPIHGGSLYLGHYPAYTQKNYSAMRQENDNQPWSAWSDLIWMYRALSDPADAMDQFKTGKDTLPREGGNSLANTYHWIGTLGKLGVVQREATANCPLYAVFDRDGKRHYNVYLHGEAITTVKFSDGFEMRCKNGLNQASSS